MDDTQYKWVTIETGRENVSAKARQAYADPCWRFDEIGRSITGTYKGRHEEILRHGKETVLDVIDEQGEFWWVRATADLKRKFDGISADTKIRITYESEKLLANGHKMKVFKVETSGGARKEPQ